jgi:hypothetical protein
MIKARQKKWLGGRPESKAARLAVMVAGVAASELLLACSSQNPPPLTSLSAGAAQTRSSAGNGISPSRDDPARRFLGKGPADMMRELGPPTKVMPSDVKGGKIYVYSQPGMPRYVFETDGTNRIDLAVTVE